MRRHPHRMDHPRSRRARQGVLKLALARFLGLKMVLARRDDTRTMAHSAKALAAWARDIPGIFPSSVHSRKLTALKTIWSGRAGCEARADDMTATAAKFATLGNAGKATAMPAQWDVPTDASSALPPVQQTGAPRDCQRLQLPRRRSRYEQDNEQVFKRGSGPCGADDIGSREQISFALIGRGVGCRQDRLRTADASRGDEEGRGRQRQARRRTERCC